MNSTKYASEQIEVSEVQSKPMNAQEIIFKYLNYLPLFIFCIGLAILLAYIYLRYAIPVYNVSSKVLIKKDDAKRSSDGLEEVMFFQKPVNISNEIEILKSRILMQRVVDFLHLNITYLGKGKIKISEVYTSAPFVLQPISITDSSQSFSFAIKIIDQNKCFVNGKEYLFNETFKNDFGEFKFTKNTIYQLIPESEFIVNWEPSISIANALLGNLEIKPISDAASVLMLSLKCANKQKGIDVIQQLINEYDSLTIEDKNIVANRTVEFIQERLKAVNDELLEVENAKEQFQIKNNLFNPESQSTQFVLGKTESEKEMQQLNLKVALAEFLENYIKDKKNRLEVAPVNLGVEDAALVNMMKEYNELVIEYTKKIKINNYSSNSNEVKKVEEQIDNLKEKILDNLKNLKRVYNIAYTEANKKNSELNSELLKMPSKERTLRQIEINRGVKEELVIYLRKKRLESEIARASTVSNLRVIDFAMVGNQVSPNSSNVYRIALLLGLFLPILIIFLKDLLNDKITTRKDIVDDTSIPVLGEIGHYDDEHPLVVSGKNKNLIAEQFRVIRTNLQFVLSKKEKPVILVTSSMSGEGKSFVSTNLAAVMALTGKKTVVLEFDLRKPKIIKNLKLGRQVGLTNYLVGNSTVEELPIRVPGIDNFYVIACGHTPPNPSEILLDKQIEELFSYLKENFDAIFIDTAPVGLVSDALILAQYADASLYIIRQRHTLKRQIHNLQELYKQQKLPKLGILVNDVKFKGHNGYYGYGYGYGYEYGYGHGYFVDSSLPWYKKIWKRLKKFLGI